MLRLWILPVLGLIAALGFACGNSGDDKPQSVTTATPTASAASFTATTTPIAASSATPIPTTVWKRFTNTDYGFSFQYPAGWYLDVHGSHPDTTMDYMAIYSFVPQQASSDPTPPPDAVKVELYIIDNPDGLALPDWIRHQDALTGSVATVVTSGDRTLDGHVGTERVVTYAPGEGSGKPSGEAYFIAGTSVLGIDGPAADSPGVQVYQEVLNSLVFN